MTYKVIRTFKDGQSEDLHVYLNGDVFPFGYDVSAERIAELSGSDNSIGMPLIVEVVDKNKTNESSESVVEPVVEIVKPKQTRTKKVIKEVLEEG